MTQPPPLLPFQRQILKELLDEDALSIVARGLGLERILAELCRACATPKALVFLIHITDTEERALAHTLMQMRSGEGTASDEAASLTIIKNDTGSSTTRARMYRQGGIISVTSRILVTDLLNKVVPLELVTGIIVGNASKVTAESMEAFILRIWRKERTNNGFVKAVSDSPEAFTLGFAPLEKTLKALGLRHVHLWPRFHVDVQRDFDKIATPVVELRQPQTRAMVELQQAALDCLQATISELNTSSHLINTDQINVETALFKYFDAMVKRQVAPHWHQLSGRVRALVSDLSSLRIVTELVTAYDCVSLLKYLDSLLISGKPGVDFAGMMWMMSDSANILFSVARSRVFRKPENPLPQSTQDDLRAHGLPPDIVPVLEVPPKWELLARVLDEIGADKANGKSKGPILVMTGSDRSCRFISRYLASLDKSVSFDIGKDNDDLADKHSQMLVNMLAAFFRWKSLTAITISNVAPNMQQSQRPPVHAGFQGGGRRQAPASKRRRMRGASQAASHPMPRIRADALEQETLELATQAQAAHSTPADDSVSMLTFGLDPHGKSPMLSTSEENDENTDSDDEWNEILASFDEHYALVPENETVVVRSYSGGITDQNLLTLLQPTHIIMYDPDPAFIRQIEIHQRHALTQLERVYFLVYDNSIEEQRYLSAIRREKESFEKLIHDKSTLVIPIDDTAMSSTGNALLQIIASRNNRHAVNNYGSRESIEMPRIVIDTREIRSPLPALLYAAGITVVPRTLEIGDYVLHDDLVIERKSIPDLVASLRSGRLFNQVEAMSRHYAQTVLLIEFEIGTSFSLQPIGGLAQDISVHSLGSQLTMLSIAFPMLRIIWSQSPYETVEIFIELKSGLAEPNVERAVETGQSTENQSVYNQAAVELLQALPGVTLRNYRKAAERFGSVRGISAASCGELEEVLGSKEAAVTLHQFMNS